MKRDKYDAGINASPITRRKWENNTTERGHLSINELCPCCGARVVLYRSNCIVLSDKGKKVLAKIYQQQLKKVPAALREDKICGVSRFHFTEMAAGRVAKVQRKTVHIIAQHIGMDAEALEKQLQIHPDNERLLTYLTWQEKRGLKP